MPLKDKMALLEGYNKLILGCPEITSSSIGYFDRHTHWHFANSEGTYIYQEKMDLGGGLAAIATKDKLTTQDSARFGSNNDYNVALGLEDEVREAAEAARQMLYAPVVEAGQYTVILDPDMAGLFVHEAFGHLSEADDLDEDERMKELLKIGTRYGTGELNIYDSGIEGPNRGECKYDDEGVPMQRTYLIKNGVIAGHLHSRESAVKMGEAATGNARALSWVLADCKDAHHVHSSRQARLRRNLKGISWGSTSRAVTAARPMRCLLAPSKAYMIRNGSIAEMVRDEPDR